MEQLPWDGAVHKILDRSHLIKYCGVRSPYRVWKPCPPAPTPQVCACRLMSETTSEERPPPKRHRENPQVGPPAPQQWTVKRPRTGSATAADIAALVGTAGVPQRSERATAAAQGPSGELPPVTDFLGSLDGSVEISTLTPRAVHMCPVASTLS